MNNLEGSDRYKSAILTPLHWSSNVRNVRLGTFILSVDPLLHHCEVQNKGVGGTSVFSPRKHVTLPIVVLLNQIGTSDKQNWQQKNCYLLLQFYLMNNKEVRHLHWTRHNFYTRIRIPAGLKRFVYTHQLKFNIHGPSLVIEGSSLSFSPVDSGNISEGQPAVIRTLDRNLLITNDKMNSRRKFLLSN